MVLVLLCSVNVLLRIFAPLNNILLLLSLSERGLCFQEGILSLLGGLKLKIGGTPEVAYSVCKKKVKKTKKVSFFILFSFILPQSFFPDTEFSLDHTSEFFGPLSNKKQSKCPLPLLCPFSFALSCFHRNTSVFCSISSRLCYLNTHIHTLTHTRECQLYSLIEHLPISSAFTHFTFHPIFLIITLLRIAEL